MYQMLPLRSNNPLPLNFLVKLVHVDFDWFLCYFSMISATRIRIRIHNTAWYFINPVTVLTLILQVLCWPAGEVRRRTPRAHQGRYTRGVRGRFTRSYMIWIMKAFQTSYQILDLSWGDATLNTVPSWLNYWIERFRQHLPIWSYNENIKISFQLSCTLQWLQSSS